MHPVFGSALTEPSPDTATELEREISLPLKQLGLDLVQWYAFDDDVLRRRVSMDVVACVALGLPDGVGSREWRDQSRGRTQVAENTGAREDGRVESFSYNAHFVAAARPSIVREQKCGEHGGSLECCTWLLIGGDGQVVSSASERGNDTSISISDTALPWIT